MTLRRMLTLFAGSLLLFGVAAAKPWWMRGVESNENDFLPPDEAFHVSSRIDGDLLRIRWVIADGYYLYRQRMQIAAESPNLVVSAIEFPPGIMKTDPYLGTQEIFKQRIEGTAAYKRADGGAHPIQIKVTYQGCAEAGLCYPPIVKVIFPDRATSEASGQAPKVPSQAWEFYAILAGGGGFLLAGLLLRKGRHRELPS